MDINIAKVTNEKKDILYRLLQFSLFELSEFNFRDVNRDFFFDYKYFDNYFTDKDRDAYFILDAGTDAILGFVMVNSYLKICNEGHSIAEFMIMPKYRRNKIGKKAAYKIFNIYKGKWEVEPIFNSEKAYLFWENVIKEYTSNNYVFKDGVFIFTN